MTSVTRVLLPKPFTMLVLLTPLMILLRRESLNSDNSEEAHDESDESIAAQAVHNDTTTDTIQELLFVEKVMQHLKQEIYWKCTRVWSITFLVKCEECG